jgi:outer membrane protein assembly factor BamB
VQPRVFVSHASPDTAFATRFSEDLRRVGADVWLDSSHMGPGDFVARLNQALQRDVVVVILSPDAIKSPWVQQEVGAAITRSNQGLMRPPIIIEAHDTPVATIPPLWTVYHRYNALSSYQDALDGVAGELGLAVHRASLPVFPSSGGHPALAAPGDRPAVTMQRRWGIRVAIALVIVPLLCFVSYKALGVVTSTPPPSRSYPVSNVVYVGSADSYLYALRASDGHLLWRLKTGGGVWPRPALVNGILYFGSDDGSLYAVRASDASVRWTFRTGGKVNTAPLVLNGAVYFGSWDGQIYAVRADDGTLIWHYGTGGIVSESSPSILAGVLYIGSSDGNVYALNADTGRFRWSYQTGDGIASSPLTAEGTIYIGSFDGYVYALGAADGSLHWRQKTGGIVASSPVLSDGVVFVSSYDHYLYALDSATGNLRWRYDVGGITGLGPAAAGGVIYSDSDDSHLYALNASSGSLIWRSRQSVAPASCPAIKYDTVYFGSHNSSVYALDVSTGELRWSYLTGGDAWGIPACGVNVFI